MAKGSIHLKEVQEMEAVIKKLKRQVERFRKQVRRIPETSRLCKRDQYKKSKDKIEKFVCPQCEKAEGIKEFKVANRLITRCDDCGWRKTEML